MPKTVWKKLESWEPIARVSLTKWPWFVANRQQERELATYARGTRVFKSRAAALLAANKQNRMEGLPEVQ